MTITTGESNLPQPTENSPTAKLQPRRTLNRLAWAGGAVVLAFLGQYFLVQGSGWGALLILAVAAVFFVRAVGHQLYPKYKLAAHLPLADTPAIHLGWPRNIGIWLMLLGAGISALGYTFFGQDDALKQAWWLYASSLILFVAGGIVLTPAPSPRAELRRIFPNRRLVLGLGLIFAIALLLRLYNFADQPFGIWYDEAEAGLQARAILLDSNYRPVFYSPINVTGHLLFIYATALAWLGNTIFAMRMVSVLFGVGTVLAAYLFGQELRGPRFGLLLAFLVAVARWNINFSRIAMTGIDTPFFELLSLFFLTRFLYRGHLRDAMWAGLTLGFGLLFYTAFRLYMFAILIFVVIAIIRWWSPLLRVIKQGGWRRYSGAIVILLFSGWLVVMPLVKYAIDHPDAFLYRTRQISIFTKRDQADLTQALLYSAEKHLLMFNAEGDKNGRHNLPGEPMLDPVMGVFLILGIGLALAQTGFPANTFFIILFFTTLLGGIFSVDFEAPQSLRSIAVFPAVIYFCGLSLAALGKEAKKSLRPLPRAWIYAPAALVAGYVLLLNAYTYFYEQANDFASWNAFSAPETITGRKMAELGPDYVYILSPFLTNHPSTLFLAPEAPRQYHLAVPDALPVRDPSGRPVALFLHPDDSWIYDEAKNLYPNAQFEILTGPPVAEDEIGPPSVYFVGLQPGDLAAVRGLDLRYWPATEAENPAETLLAPLLASRAFNVNTVWPDDSPTPDNFIAEWNGVLYAPLYGTYNFRLVAPAESRLEIDGNPILEGQGDMPAPPVPINLGQGNHTISVRAEGAPGEVALYWQPPGQSEELVPNWVLYALPITNHGLRGSFYPNANWEGEPVLQRVDPFLDTYFHLVPLQRPYTVEWEGALLAPQSGVYRLGLRAVQEAQLIIDGDPLLITVAPNQYTEAPLTLKAGLHDIKIKYLDSVDRSRVHLMWTPPNGAFGPVPKEYLWPPMGSYPAPDAVSENRVEVTPFRLRYLDTIGNWGDKAGQFIEPRDVAVLSNGNVAVADTGNRRVQIFDVENNVVLELTGDEFPFEEPVAVAVLPRATGDQILVLDSTLQWVYRYDEDGFLIDRFGGPEARLFHPRGLTVFDDNSIGIADTGTARIALFDAEGNPAGSIGGESGNAPGQLNEPTDAVRDSLRTYFVAEAENDRIQRLDIGGNPVNQWNIPPAYAYNGPHLTFGPDGTLLATESQSHAILRYTPSGVLVDQWQSVGPVTLSAPVGIYFDPTANRLYVTDVDTHQVHVFGVELVVE